MERNCKYSNQRYTRINNKFKIVGIVFIFFLFSIFSFLYGEKSNKDNINKAILLYDNGEYKNVVDILQKLVQDTTISLEDEINARTYLSFSYIALGRKTEAKAQFIKILKKNKNFSLNPEFVSPKIMEVFEEAKKSIETGNSNNIIKIRKTPPSTTHCLVKTTLFPGWGQISRGEGNKGKFLIGAFSVSLAALALSHFAYLSAENSYLSAVTKSDIEYQYSRYNFAYKARYITAEISLFIWLYGVSDILLDEHKETEP
jgi:tetratricopeptide (TPR) repeat protein